jgi:alanine racemase
MTHFLAADGLDFEHCEIQRHKFRNVCKSLPIAGRRMASSVSSYSGEDFWGHIFHPGKSTSGINPLTGQKNPLRQPASVYAPLFQVETVKKRTALGYSSTIKSVGETRIATLGIGSVRGDTRSASNCRLVAEGGIYVPVVGRVFLDVTAIDITALPLDLQRLGFEVEVLGPKVTTENLAKKCGTIGHEILIDLGQKSRPTYFDDDTTG